MTRQDVMAMNIPNKLVAVPAGGAPSPDDAHADEGRNPGTALDLDWVAEVRVNRSAVERRAATIGTRRTVKKEWQAAWLLRAITLMDLTTLSGDDTPGNVRRLCAKARQPVRRRPARGAGRARAPHQGRRRVRVPPLVPDGGRGAAGSGIPVAAVSTGFPAGLSPFEQRVEEIRESVAAGARRSTSSSPASTCSPATTRRSTTRCAPSARRAATRT
jgi:deoxyribose-phosphate aldolase